MRSRLVIWGTNKEEQRVLLAISLNAEDNKVSIWSIPEASISEEFYNQMMSQWREGLDMDLPKEAQERIIELTMADTILPEDLRVEKSDVIQRAQLEWHFIVLSTKLYKNFKSDLEDLQDKIKRLEEFDQTLWDELKQFWSNVQQHIIDKNILRDHSDSLKEKTNALFEELKKLRKQHQSTVNQKSKDTATLFLGKLEEVDEKIKNGSVLKPLFDGLIEIQNQLKKQDLTRKDRELVLSKLNECFKSIREKRENQFAGKNPSESGQQKLDKRFEGLMTAINRIQQSIEFEEKNIFFENKRIATTDGQLEAQIRVAKIKMIEERLKSKQAKLAELLETKEKLESLQDKLKKKDEKDKKRQERRQQVENEKIKVIAQIADDIQHHQEAIPEDVQEKLMKAAEDIKQTNKSKRNKPGENTKEQTDLTVSTEQSSELQEIPNIESVIPQDKEEE